MKCRAVRAEGQEYLLARSFAFSDRGCREKAFRMASKAMKAGPGTAIPAMAEEIRCIQAGSSLSEEVVRAAKEERVALAALSVASKRRLSCAEEGATRVGGRLADVVIRELGDAWSVKVLSGSAVPMQRERLRDLLDLYDMFVAQ
jgi:hypothetical protein